MLGAAFQLAIPHAVKTLAVQKLIVAWREPDNRAALLSHQIAHRDADRVAEPACLPHDLIRRQQLAFGRAAQALDLFHLAFGLERSEEHTSELQSLMRISYAVFCLKKKTKQ